MAAPARLWAAHLGLVEALPYFHTGLTPPLTYQYGSHPIDGIFVLPELLTNAQGSYLGFGKAIASNHRAIWLNLDLPQLCPSAGEAYLCPTAQCLQCKDPRIIVKYNAHLWSQLQQHKIPERLMKAVQTIKQGFLPHNQCKELNAIDQEITIACHAVEQQCQKFHSGHVPWCPLMTHAINCILYWKGVMKQQTGGYIGTTILWSQAKKAGLKHSIHQLNHLQKEIKGTYKRFHCIKQ